MIAQHRQTVSMPACKAAHLCGSDKLPAVVAGARAAGAEEEVLLACGIGQVGVLQLAATTELGSCGALQQLGHSKAWEQRRALKSRLLFVRSWVATAASAAAMVANATQEPHEPWFFGGLMKLKPPVNSGLRESHVSGMPMPACAGERSRCSVRSGLQAYRNG